MRDLRQTVQADLARRWTVASLARTAGVGRSRLGEVWRAVHGVPPIEDLIAARIARAQWLLRAAAQPVAETARAVGFTDVHHFTRCFRARVGVPPGVWRAG